MNLLKINKAGKLTLLAVSMTVVIGMTGCGSGSMLERAGLTTAEKTESTADIAAEKEKGSAVKEVDGSAAEGNKTGDGKTTDNYVIDWKDDALEAKMRELTGI